MTPIVQYAIFKLTYKWKYIYLYYYLQFFFKWYQTDDKIIVWVTANGKFGAYSAFNLNRYESFKNTDFDLKETLKELDKKSLEKKYKLKDTYVSLSEDGTPKMIFLAYDIETSETTTIEIPLNEVN